MTWNFYLVLEIKKWNYNDDDDNADEGECAAVGANDDSGDNDLPPFDHAYWIGEYFNAVGLRLLNMGC